MATGRPCDCELSRRPVDPAKNEQGGHDSGANNVLDRYYLFNSDSAFGCASGSAGLHDDME